MNTPLLDGIVKEADVLSEALGTALWGISGIPLITGVVGATKPLTQEEFDRQKKRNISNILIPGLGSYRLGRRLRGDPSKK